MNSSKNYALKLDAQDELHRYRQEFYLPANAIYMDGNSLGLLSKRAEQSLAQVVEAYKLYGIDSWTKGKNPYFYMAEKLGDKIAPLVGALEGEVVITGSTTVNLHQLVATFFEPKGTRTKILIDEFAFPTDVYAVKSQLLLHGLDPSEHLVLVKSTDGQTISEDDIISLLTDEVALLILPTVVYSTGQLLDIKRITTAAHDHDALVGFDASHSVGVVPHNFHEDGVDMAVFCTYKYVNGGPGAPAGIFVHQKHFGKYPALAGWFSSRKDVQFDMAHDLVPADNAGAYQIGTPHVLSMAPLQGALELISEVGILRIRKKSSQLTEYLIELVNSELRDMGFAIASPLTVDARGGHVALRHKEAASICKALKNRGVVPDFRFPDIVRLAPSPLYGSFVDVYEAVQILKDIMTKRDHLAFSNKREIIA